MNGPNINPREKVFDSKKNRLPPPRSMSPSPSMTRKLRLLAWALTLQILPLHAQEEDHSNDDIQDPNTPILLVRALFFSFLSFTSRCSLQCRSEPIFTMYSTYHKQTLFLLSPFTFLHTTLPVPVHIYIIYPFRPRSSLDSIPD